MKSRRWFSVTIAAVIPEPVKSTSMLRENGWNGVRIVTAEDHAVIHRQLNHRLSGTIAVGSRCAHGYPQAEILAPRQRGISGHLVRLSCPLLCQFIDKWENDGAVRTESTRLSEDQNWKCDLDRINARHANTRKNLIDARRIAAARAKYGDHATETVMNSGIAGLSPHKHNDIKCIHAIVADELLADQKGLIATHFLDTLESRGCNIAGTSNCHEHCAGIEGGWRYFPLKNKQRLRQRRDRRRALYAKNRRSIFDIKNITSINNNDEDNTT